MISIPSRLLRPPSSPPLSSLAVSVSNFSTSQSHASVHQFQSRRHEEASRGVKVLVWWDFENCAVPAGVNVGKVANMISAAVRTNGIRGPLKIMAFGDVCRLSKTTLDDFSHTGVDLSHVPQGGKNSADTSIIINIMYWTSQNPPPAHLFLISGDKDFAGVLHRLRMNNYNVLLASPRSGPAALCSAASIMWEWRSLINGDDLKGKHFNQPPDGPYGSWYGHDRAALQDPFSIEQLTCVQAEESSKVFSNSKFQPIPKVIIRNIMTILCAYPKGLSITVLRLELIKRNVNMDKDFYGHKKFSSFLESMHQSLRLRHEGGGQLYVRRVIRRASEPSKCTDTVSEYDNVTGDEDVDAACSAFSGDDISNLDAAAGRPTCHPSCEVSEGANQPELRLTPCSPHGEENSIEFGTENPQTPPPDLMKDVENSSEKLCEIHQHSRLGSVSVHEESFPRTLLRILYGCSVGSVNKLMHNLGLFEHVDKLPESFASDSSKMKNEKSATVRISKPAKRQGGFLSWMLNLCWFRNSDQDNVAAGDIPSQRPNTKKFSSKKNDPFTEDSFWDEVKTFINSTRGSVLISRSETRDEMAENLMKEGPPVVKSLSRTDVMQLMELLISGNKWVEECLSTTPRFRVVRVGEKSCNTVSTTANPLTSIFPKFQGNSQNENLEEGKFKVIPDSGFSAQVANDESSVQSRKRVIFSDCRKLVKHVTEEHPEGYNIGSFKKSFLDTYGYTLDYKKLGYQKLVSLLEVMPCVKVQGNNMFPASVSRGCSNSK